MQSVMGANSALDLRCAWLIGGVCAVFCTVGCSDQQIRYAPVTGFLTIDGKPISRAEVVFSCEVAPADGPRPTTRAVTDEAGRFVLRSLTPQKDVVNGAVVGRHRIFVTTRIVEQDDRGNSRVTREELLSREYTNGQKLTVDVPPEGIDDLQFELTSK